MEEGHHVSGTVHKGHCRTFHIELSLERDTREKCCAPDASNVEFKCSEGFLRPYPDVGAPPWEHGMIHLTEVQRHQGRWAGTGGIDPAPNARSPTKAF